MAFFSVFRELGRSSEGIDVARWMDGISRTLWSFSVSRCPASEKVLLPLHSTLPTSRRRDMRKREDTHDTKRQYQNFRSLACVLQKLDLEETSIESRITRIPSLVILISNEITQVEVVEIHQVKSVVPYISVLLLLLIRFSLILARIERSR